MAATYLTITLNNGTATPYHSQTVISDTQIEYLITEFETVTITANEIAGKTFDHWEASSSSAQNGIADRTASTTTFYNDYGNVTITAVYTEPINYLDKDGLTTLVANIKNELATRDSEINALLDQIPTATAEGETINVQDSSNLPIKDFAMLGNATQADTPTPDTPQDIHVVTGDNTVNALGKNVADFTTLPISERNSAITTRTGGTFSIVAQENQYAGAGFLQTNLKLKPNTTYTFSARVVSTTSSTGSSVFIRATYTQDNTQIYGNKTSAGGTSYATFTTPATIPDDSFIALYVREANKTAVFDNVMLEEGNTVSSYEEYTPKQTQLLSLGSIELAKIGDYADKLFHAVAGNTIYESLDSTTKASLTVGKWYKQENIARRTLYGSETWHYVATSSNHIFYVENLINSYVRKAEKTCMSPSYMSIANVTSSSGIGNAGNNLICFRANPNDTIKQLFITDNRFSSKDDFAAWLTNNNLVVAFASTTPTYIEITDTTLISQLENVLKMHTNKNITNAWIEPTGTNAQAGLTLTYYRDLQTITDKVDSLEARVSLLE